MQVEIKIDDSCIEPRVIIITDKVTDEIRDILNTLSSKTPEVITGFHNDLAVKVLYTLSGRKCYQRARVFIVRWNLNEVVDKSMV